MTPLTKQNARQYIRVQYRYHRPNRVVTGVITHVVGQHVKVLFDDNTTAIRNIDSFILASSHRK